MLDFILRRDASATLHARVHDLQHRLEKLESAPKSKDKNYWDKLQAIAGMLSPFAILIAGALVTHAVGRRQAQLGEAKEMQTLIGGILEAQDADKATAAAIGLSAYGDIALEPLRQLIRSKQASVALAAQEGLRSVGTTKPGSVCKAMQQLIDNRTQLYSFETHRFAVRLIGQLRCHRARPALENYVTMLEREGLDGYKRYVAPDPVPNQQTVDQLRAEARAVLDSLKVSGGT